MRPPRRKSGFDPYCRHPPKMGTRWRVPGSDKLGPPHGCRSFRGSLSCSKMARGFRRGPHAQRETASIHFADGRRSRLAARRTRAAEAERGNHWRPGASCSRLGTDSGSCFPRRCATLATSRGQTFGLNSDRTKERWSRLPELAAGIGATQSQCDRGPGFTPAAIAAKQSDARHSNHLRGLWESMVGTGLVGEPRPAGWKYHWQLHPDRSAWRKNCRPNPRDNTVCEANRGASQCKRCLLETISETDPVSWRRHRHSDSMRS